MYRNYRMFLLTLCMFFITSPAVADRQIRVNFSTGTLTVIEDRATLMKTAVVLPRGNYYTVPVSGVVTRAVMGPVWTPTANMRRQHPGRYRSSYGPYAPGNAMGHCKLYINFASSDPIMKVVRIHGNARQDDLGKRLSRSCIRIPDDLCGKLTGLVNNHQGEVNVLFHW